jgi:hypothetical protein
VLPVVVELVDEVVGAVGPLVVFARQTAYATARMTTTITTYQTCLDIASSRVVVGWNVQLYTAE